MSVNIEESLDLLVEEGFILHDPDYELSISSALDINSVVELKGSAVLDGLNGKPVTVVTDDHPRAVLIGLDLWNMIIEKLEDQEDLILCLAAEIDPRPTTNLRSYLEARSNRELHRNMDREC